MVSKPSIPARASQSDTVTVAVGLQPTVTMPEERCVAERRLNSRQRLSSVALRRERTWLFEPWVESHGYRHSSLRDWKRRCPKPFDSSGVIA